jgi:DNA-binding Xre family transcriptional regulator
MIKSLIKVALLLSFTACLNSDDSASGHLRKFVKKTTDNLSQDGYADYAAQDLLESIISMDEEEFKNFQEQSNVEGVKVDILSESCQELSCTITYVTKYQTKTSDGSIYGSEVRKLAELVKSDEGWRVTSVKNVKTYLEANNIVLTTWREAKKRRDTLKN